MNMRKAETKPKPTSTPTPTKKDKAIMATIAGTKEKIRETNKRARAVESAALILRNMGVQFDRGHVMLISQQKKFLVAFDVSEYGAAIKKFADVNGLDFFHLTKDDITPYAKLQNIVTRIGEGRGREIFVVTSEQKAAKRADKKVASKIMQKTGGKIGSKKYPARSF